jgi:hypothetical protein
MTTTMTLDPRSPATMEAAERALAEAEAAERAASAEVEEARIALAMEPGKPNASRRNLAQRRLAVCQEATAQAAAAIKAIGRERVRLDEVDRETRLVDRRAKAVVLEAERVVLAEQVAMFLVGTISSIQSLDRRIIDWSDRARLVRGSGGVSLGHLDPPSTLRIAFDRALDGLWTLEGEYRRHRKG